MSDLNRYRHEEIRITAFLMLLLVAMFPACAAGPEVRVGAWVTYWDHDRGMKSVETNVGAISDVMLFAVHLDSAGRPILARPEWDIGEAVMNIREADATPWLTVVNDVVGVEGRRLKDSSVVRDILRDPKTRKAHARQIVAIAIETGVAGVDIDYENLDLHERDPFSLFIVEMAEQLKAQDLALSVTVQPKRGESRSRGPGAADWKALCQSADRLQIMMYNLHNVRTEPGPVATSPWIDEIVDYALTVCEPERIVPVLKVGGYDWGASGTKDATFHAAATLLDSGAAIQYWDRKSRSPFITYEMSGEERIAYFENRKSLQRKIRKIRRHGLERIMIWSFGREDPRLIRSPRPASR